HDEKDHERADRGEEQSAREARELRDGEAAVGLLGARWQVQHGGEGALQIRTGRQLALGVARRPPAHRHRDEECKGAEGAPEAVEVEQVLYVLVLAGGIAARGAIERERDAERGEETEEARRPDAQAL